MVEPKGEKAMLSEHEKEVTLRTLKKILNEHNKKLNDIDASTIEGWKIPNIDYWIQGITKTILLVENEETSYNK